MIVVKLWGGLGNQLFQYAFGYQLSKRINTELALDVSWFDTQNTRRADILDFNIKYDGIVNTWKIDNSIMFWNKPVPNRFLRIPEFGKYKIGSFNYLKETRYKFFSKINEYNEDNSYLDGYWQCPRYFDNVKTDLTEMYKTQTIREEVRTMGDRLKKNNTTAIHVRRGDYPSKKKIGIRLMTIGEEYYQHAIKYMLDVNRDTEMYLFSNDIDAAKKLYYSVTNKTCHIVSEELNLSSLEEWYLMGCCNHYIIGNSTFSWWAAYLGGHEDKIVCAPSSYWGNDDIIPTNWIKVTI